MSIVTASNTSDLISYDFNTLKIALLANLKTYSDWVNVNDQDTVLQMVVHILGYYTTFILGNVNRAFVDYFPNLTASDKILYDFANFITAPINATSSAIGEVTFSLDAAAPKQVILPIGTEVSDGSSIIYSTNEYKTINIGEISVDVNVIQGQYKSTTFTSSGTNWQKYYINIDVDKDNIVVKVNGTTWTPVTSFLFSTNISTHYMVKYISNGFYILFGDGITGTIPTSGFTIVADYVETLGIAGNVIAVGINTINSQIYYDDASIVNDASITNTLAISSAVAADDDSTIQQNIQSYMSYNPYLSTKQDYIDYVKTYPTVYDADVYAGWEIYSGSPLTYSTLYLYIVKFNQNVFSTTEKEEILNFIQLKNMYVTKVDIQDVAYVGVYLTTDVKLIPTITQAEITSIRSQVNTIMQNHFDFATITTEGDTVFRDVYNSSIVDKIMNLNTTNGNTNIKRVNLSLQAVELIGLIGATTSTYTTSMQFTDYDTPKLYIDNELAGTFGLNGVNYQLDAGFGSYTLGGATKYTVSIVGSALQINILDLAFITGGGYTGKSFYLRNVPADDYNLTKTIKTVIFSYYSSALTIS